MEEQITIKRNTDGETFTVRFPRKDEATKGPLEVVLDKHEMGYLIEAIDTLA